MWFYGFESLHTFAGNTQFLFEIDCQIIGSKHFLVCTLDFLEQKPIIISNLKFESSFRVSFEKENAKCRLTKRIFMLNNFVVFILAFVMPHSTDLNKINRSHNVHKWKRMHFWFKVVLHNISTLIRPAVLCKVYS